MASSDAVSESIGAAVIKFITVEDDEYDAEDVLILRSPRILHFSTGEQIQHHLKRHWDLVEAPLSISSL